MVKLRIDCLHDCLHPIKASACASGRLSINTMCGEDLINQAGVALTYHANELGFDCATQLLQYAQVFRRRPHCWPNNRYPAYWYMFHAAFGSDDNPHAFEIGNAFYIAVCTRPERADIIIKRFQWLLAMCKGRLSCAQEAQNSNHYVVLRHQKHFSGVRRKDILVWWKLSKPTISANSAYQQMMNTVPLPHLPYGGWVEDHKEVFNQSDYPKIHLYPAAEGHIENNFGLRHAFPEMVTAYQRRSFHKWRHLWDIIPGRQTFGREWCYRPEACKQDRKDSDCRCDLRTGEGFSHCHFKEEENHGPDVNCGAEDYSSHLKFTYLHEIDEWIPAVLIPEYRLRRMHERRLNRLLRPLVLRYLYECPDGILYKKTAATTLVGRLIS
jgi:hypothetical protein